MTLDVEPVAQRLLVEAGLRAPRLVTVGRPEARAVRRHHLVDQQDLARLRTAELEFGIGDDDALLQGDVAAARIDDAGEPLELGRHVGAQHLPHAAHRDVLVMAALGLGRGTEDRRIEPVAFLQAGRQLLAGQRAVLGIFPPGRAREIAADHAFDRKDRAAPAQHGPAGELIAMWLQGRHGGRDLVGVGRDHVMPHGVAELAKPPGAHLRQHRALHRDRLGHHHVVSAHPVRRHQQQPVALDLVDVAHLAAGDPPERQIARRHQQHFIPRCPPFETAPSSIEMGASSG
jgi:hypothetical protein